MKKVIEAIDRGLSFIYFLFNFIASIGLLFIVGSISYNVIARSFFNQSAGWTVEVSEYLMIVICFFTIGWILKIGGHVKVDLLTSVVNRKWRLILQMISNSLGFVSSLIISYYALLIVVDHMNRNVVLLKILEVPKHWVLFPIMLGFFLLAIQFFRNILHTTIEIRLREEDDHIWNGG